MLSQASRPQPHPPASRLREHRRTARKLLLPAVLAAAITVSGCSQAPAASSSPAANAAADGAAVHGGDLTFGVETEPVTLNPHLNGLAKVSLQLTNAYETLFARDEDGGFVPLLATDYEISEDGTTYTIGIRDDVVFHDGEALTADVVKLNIEKLLDPDYSSSGPTGPFSRVSSIEATDATTLQLVLSEPYSPLLGALAGLYVISPAAFESPELETGGPSIAGTGPFQIASYSKGQQLVFERYEEYDWAPETKDHEGPAYLDSVTYRFLGESGVRIGALTGGQVDIIDGVPARDVPTVTGADLTYESNYLTGIPYTVYFNSQFEPTSDIRVRQAFRHAVDVDAILTSTFGEGQRSRGWGLTVPTDPFYLAELEDSIEFDVDEANRLLDEAGWTGRDSEGYRTKDGETLSLVAYQNQSQVRDSRDVLLSAVQAQVRQNAGIKFDLQFVDSATATQHRTDGDYAIYANTTSSTDGRQFESVWRNPTSGGFINYAKATDPQFDEWITAAALTTDIEERRSFYDQVQRLAHEQAYTLPLYVAEDQIAYSSEVHGAGFTTFGANPDNVYDVWLSE